MLQQRGRLLLLELLCNNVPEVAWVASAAIQDSRAVIADTASNMLTCAFAAAAAAAAVANCRPKVD